MVEFKGGRLPNDPTKPRLRLSDFLPNLQKGGNPQVRDWLSAVPAYPMYLNDQLGDCTCAMVGHQIEAFTQYGQGAAFEVTDNDVLTAYEAVSGYVPGDPSTDNGAVIQDVMSYWQKTGVGGHKIVAFAEVNIANPAEVHSAINYFGSVSVGVNFPTGGMTQFNNGQMWTPIPGDTIDGGHAIHVGAYNWPAKTLTCVTWGARQEMTQSWWNTYVEEAWVIITQDWINKASQLDPLKQGLATLNREFVQLTGQPLNG